MPSGMQGDTGVELSDSLLLDEEDLSQREDVRETIQKVMTGPHPGAPALKGWHTEDHT